jgi:hypothetical protein
LKTPSCRSDSSPPENKIAQSYSPLFPIPDTDSTEPDENDKRELNTTTLSEEEWIETLNKHDSFDQYAKKRRERRREGTPDETD